MAFFPDKPGIVQRVEALETAPPAHAASHAAGGSDALTPANIGALSVDGTAVNAVRWNGAAKTVSSAGASGGADGDVWFQYV